MLAEGKVDAAELDDAKPELRCYVRDWAKAVKKGSSSAHQASFSPRGGAAPAAAKGRSEWQVRAARVGDRERHAP